MSATPERIAEAVRQVEPFADQARNLIRKCVNRNRVGRTFFVAIRYRFTDDESGKYAHKLPVDELLKIGKGHKGETFVGFFLAPWDTAEIRDVSIKPGLNPIQPMVRIFFTVKRERMPAPAPVAAEAESSDEDAEVYGWFGVPTLADAMGDE